MWYDLIHNGVKFHEKYEFKKLCVHLKNNKIIQLNNKSEEILCIFVKCKYHEKMIKDKIFMNNFWKSLREVQPVFGKIGYVEIDFDKFLKFVTIRDSGTCGKSNISFNGIKVLIPNIYVEPTLIFKGRGVHPLRGTVKWMVTSRDVTLNISKAYVNELKKKEAWLSVITNQDAYWLACWIDPVLQTKKYIHINNIPLIKHKSDKSKFELARKLKNVINKIRKENDEYIIDKNMKKQQIALALHMIEKTSIRVGNEEKYNKSVGCCSLQPKHIKLLQKPYINISFEGKDSIPFSKTIVLQDNYYKVLLKCIRNSPVFDKISPSCINRYLNKFTEGLTAKVYRTYNANKIFQKELKTNTNADALNRLKNANLKVAKVCNHKYKHNNDYKLGTSTSKKNYIDPRIIVSFCKKNEIDISRVFDSNSIKQHNWALGVDENYIF
jgi:DNA topoisomerase-1